MGSSTKIFAVIGVAAVIGFGVYAINESRKSDAEKIGDSIEEVGEDIEDAVKD
ncbi:MAG: hypothetical protein VX640_10015 [Pseudomonadota bacterium]|nr:hypothetical protein [Pseudomonadota bacterium]